MLVDRRLARPRSKERRDAIVAGTIAAVAEAGVGASTWTIAKHAGVSEGTVFTYFATKDELLNEVYVELQASATDYVMKRFPSRASIPTRIRHFWTRGLAWALENPLQQRAVAHLRIWNGLTAESVRRGEEVTPRLHELLREAREAGISRDFPDELVIAAAAAMQQMTIDLTLRDPKKAAVYRKAGLEILKSGTLRR